MPILSHFLVHFTNENVSQFFSRENLANMGAQTLIVLLVWSCLWGLFEKDAEPPNGHLFNMWLIIVMAHISGKLMELFNLPALLGMIIVGFLLNNRDQIGVEPLTLDDDLKRILRHMALVIVLIRAGLELDGKTLCKMTTQCLRLAFIPCIVETVTITLTAYYLLDFTIQWGFLLGFVLAAVSPAVIVPPILNFKRNGLGMDKGIPTLLIASASIDDILSLVGFGTCFKLIFIQNVSIVYLMFKICAEPIIGVMTGMTIGLILWYIPSAHSSETQKLFLLVFGGMAAQFLFTETDMRATGPEACFVAACVAAWRWRSDKSFHRIESHLKDLWVIFQAILFGLIGTEVRMSEMVDDDILLAFICISAGLFMRFVTTISVLYGTNFTFKEKIFIGFAWLPKATFQVAIVPFVLEMADSNKEVIDYQTNLSRARLVIDIAFLAVLLTAPLGAIAISILGPKILNTSTEEKTLSGKKKQFKP